MLLINANTINNSIPLRKWVDSMEEAMKISLTDEFLMPPRPHYDYQGNTLLIMPAFIPDYFATKMVSVFPENTNKSLPTLYGTVILNDGKTGKALAILEGGKLTAMRTGAVGGLGVRHLSPKKANSLGIIGAGIQGLHQAIFACNERQIEKVFVFDTHAQQFDKFKTALEEIHPQVMIHEMKSVEDLIDKSDIIITATASEKPVIPDFYANFGNKTYIAIGSFKPNMQELPDKLFEQSNQLFVDTLQAKIESGDIINPLNNKLIQENEIFTIADVVSAKIKIDFNKPRIFKSVGMALFDLMAAKTIYKEALKNNLGYQYELHE